MWNFPSFGNMFSGLSPWSKVSVTQTQNRWGTHTDVQIKDGGFWAGLAGFMTGLNTGTSSWNACKFPGLYDSSYSSIFTNNNSYYNNNYLPSYYDTYSSSSNNNNTTTELNNLKTLGGDNWKIVRNPTTGKYTAVTAGKEVITGTYDEVETAIANAISNSTLT